MCGICAIAGNSDVSLNLYRGLLALEYRGYDSCGITVFDGKELKLKKNVGEVKQVNQKEKFSHLQGNIGIAHTRWATHGGVTQKNAHPHFSNDGKFTIVHNGIIANYASLRETLKKKKYTFHSNTDTEVIVNLVQECYKKNSSLENAFISAIRELEGSFAIVLLSIYEPQKLYAVKKDSPLIIGLGDKKNFVASDANAFISESRKALYLEDCEYVILSKEKVEIKKVDTQETIKKEVQPISWSVNNIQKGGFRHFMLKEIFEQPQTINNSLNVDKDVLEKVASKFLKHEQSFFVGVGTTYYVSMIGSYLFSKYAGIYVPAISSDEFNSLLNVKDSDHALYLSQSGETYDTREALKTAKKCGMETSGIINVQGSSISRTVDDCIYQLSGPEISVVSTKAALSQIMILMRLAFYIGKKNGKLTTKKVLELEKGMQDFSSLISKELNEQSGMVRHLASISTKISNWLFLGRDIYYPIAMESSLKMKEVTYLHAEGMSAGFLKHGTLAMVDSSVCSLFFMPPKAQKKIYESSLIALEEVKARNGLAMGFVEKGNPIEKLMDYSFYIPEMMKDFVPFYELVIAQLFSYYSALCLKRNIDKPRNLAKSVTVQ